MNVLKLIKSHLNSGKKNESIINEIKNKKNPVFMVGTSLRKYLVTNELNHVYDEITKEKVIHNSVMRDLEIRKNKLQISVYGDIQETI